MKYFVLFVALFSVGCGGGGGGDDAVLCAGVQNGQLITSDPVNGECRNEQVSENPTPAPAPAPDPTPEPEPAPTTTGTPSGIYALCRNSTDSTGSVGYWMNFGADGVFVYGLYGYTGSNCSGIVSTLSAVLYGGTYSVRRSITTNTGVSATAVDYLVAVAADVELLSPWSGGGSVFIDDSETLFMADDGQPQAFIGLNGRYTDIDFSRPYIPIRN